MIDEPSAPEAPTRVQAFLVAQHIPPEWELENIVVAPTARREGLGSRLVQHLLSIARKSNSDAMFLEVRESNIAARRLYEKLGFRENGRRKAYYSTSHRRRGFVSQIASLRPSQVEIAPLFWHCPGCYSCVNVTLISRFGGLLDADFERPTPDQLTTNSAGWLRSTRSMRNVSKHSPKNAISAKTRNWKKCV